MSLVHPHFCDTVGNLPLKGMPKTGSFPPGLGNSFLAYRADLSRGLPTERVAPLRRKDASPRRRTHRFRTRAVFCLLFFFPGEERAHQCKDGTLSEDGFDHITSRQMQRFQALGTIAGNQTDLTSKRFCWFSHVSAGYLPNW